MRKRRFCFTETLETSVYHNWQKFAKTFDLRQQPTGEILQQQTAKVNEVRLDICARGFWKAGQKPFFDERFLNPNTIRYVKLELSKIYEVNDKKGKTVQ